MKQFTDYSAMNVILDIFFQAGLLEEKIVLIYKAICHTYCTQGFHGLLQYEINNAQKTENKKVLIEHIWMHSKVKRNLLSIKYLRF